MYNNKNNVIMRKILNYLLTAATVCGISFAAASCTSSDDNPVSPDAGETFSMEKGVVMQDLGSRGWSRKGQVLDKIFYVNPVDAVRRLKPMSVTVDSVGFVREDGWTPLGDHSPLSAVFCFER